MCHHHAVHFTRRGLIACGTVGLAAAGHMVRPARAAGHIEALAITCMDYRLVDDSTRFFDKMKLTNEYDLVALAGASLAATSPKFPSSNAAFWDHVAISKQLHGIAKLIVVDHRDCGAYKVAFAPPPGLSRDEETAMHKKEMAKLKAMMAERQPDLGIDFYLMDLDGSAEAIPV